ncbi:MAG: hypothetical protein AB7V56_16650 [Candidatus Nitrosocosmicus sp.]
MNTRNRTPSEFVYYAMYLYFSGLSLRRVSERLSCFVKRNHVSIWNWVQKYKPQKLKSTSRRVLEYIVDETMLKVGSEYIWLWVAIEPKNRQILALLLLINLRKETCLLLKYIFQLWSKFMKNIQFQQTVEYGTQWLSFSCSIIIISIHSFLWQRREKFDRKKDAIHKG